MPPSPPPLRAFLFDLDGTLVRTFIDFPGMREAARNVSARYGVREAVEDENDILEIVEKTVRALPAEKGSVARREALALLETLEIEGCAAPEPVEGASALLHRLRDIPDVGVAIITRNCRRVAEDLLTRMDLPHDVLIAREDVREFKPHPAPVLAALRHLDRLPDEAVMVGDLWADIAAGRAAGVRLTIGIRWPYDPPDRFAPCPPDVEVPSLLAALPHLFA